MMNFEKGVPPLPLRVLIVNPLAPASQMIAMKILDGSVFSKDVLIDLTFLVYENELEAAEALHLALDACAYSRTNSIKVSSQLPSITDADVFCFITNFPNPNFIDFNESFDSDAFFDTFYLLLKLAYNFSLHPPPPAKPDDDFKVPLKKRNSQKKDVLKPIFMTDGLVSLDILSSFSKHIPADALFCPTSLEVIAKAVLGDYLKVTCDVINEVLVWAANDNIFHVEIIDPCLTYDTVNMKARRCTWKKMGNEVMESLHLDHTQFNASWMKKEFIRMIGNVMSRHPYGCISKASEFSKALRDIWSFRTDSENKKAFANVGVISDGSLESIKGCPYVLPVIFNGDTRQVDTRFDETIYLKTEIKRMNKAVRNHHAKLINYCKSFLNEHVLKLTFVPKDESSSTYSILETPTSPPLSSDFSTPYTSFCLAPATKLAVPNVLDDRRSSD